MATPSAPARIVLADDDVLLREAEHLLLLAVLSFLDAR
jgi:hypothetical protein